MTRHAGPVRARLPGRAAPTQRERDEVHRPLVARMRLVQPRLMFLHAPNEGDVPVQRRTMLRDMGLLTGCPDLLIFTPPPSGWRRGPSPWLYMGAALELKAPGATPTDAQLAVLAELAALGWATGWAAGLPAAVAQLRAWGYPIPVVGGI